MSDVAETLDVPIDEAAALLRQANSETPHVAPSEQSTTKTKQLTRPDKIIIATLCIIALIAILGYWAKNLRVQGLRNSATPSVHGVSPPS